jgi:hypothetical protein
MPETTARMFAQASILTATMLVSSCATIVTETTRQPESRTKAPGGEVPTLFQTNPPPVTRFKNGKNLKLVSMMEGGACNSRQQGAKGAFLVYADSSHIERIKREKGSQIFRDFQTDIQTFALQALRVSVEQTNIADNPFALDVRQSENQVIKQLLSGFSEAIAPAINSFEEDNGLMIDVQPFLPSMIFLLEECDANLD